MGLKNNYDWTENVELTIQTVNTCKLYIAKEFEQTLEDSEGQRSLVRCSPFSHKELDIN